MDSAEKLSLSKTPPPLKNKENKRDNILEFLTFSEKPDIFISDYQMDGILLWKGVGHMEEAEGYITAIYLGDYLSGRKSLRLTEKDELYIVESKIGIARNRVTKANTSSPPAYISFPRCSSSTIFLTNSIE